jgi:hypothetical protein
MKYTVRLMPRAFADGDRIYLWIAKRSPRGAVAWFEAFLRAPRDSRLSSHKIYSKHNCAYRFRNSGPP